MPLLSYIRPLRNLYTNLNMPWGLTFVFITGAFCMRKGYRYILLWRLPAKCKSILDTFIIITQIWMTAVGVNNIQLCSNQLRGCIQCLHLKNNLKSLNSVILGCNNGKLPHTPFAGYTPASQVPSLRNFNF